MFKKLPIFLVLLFSLTLSACEKQMSKSEQEWDRIVKSGENTTVNITYYTDENIERWIKEDFSKEISDSTGIDLKTEYLSFEELLGNLSAHAEDTEPNGDIDIAIISGNDLEKLRTKNFLYEPFTGKLPNFNQYMSSKDYSNSNFNFVEISESAISFSQSQLAYFYNNEMVFDPPEDLDSLMLFVKENPGKFSYPNPKTPEGKAFLQSVILDFTNIRDFMDKDLDEKELRKLIVPALNYLRSIKPYLKGAGRFHPMDMKEYDSLYSKGELYITMSLDHNHAEKMVDELIYPDYTRSFEFINSSVGTRTYAVIPYNSKNKSGAMLVLNTLLSPKVQESLYKCKDFSSTMVYSYDKIEGETKSTLDKKFKKKTVPKPSKMIEIRKSPIPEKYWNYILREWQKI